MAQCLSFFSYCSSLGVGCYLYTDPKRTTPVGAGWVSDGTTSYQVTSSGLIITASSCNIPYGTYLYSQCDVCNLVAIRADGYGGSYQAEVIQYNTEACCFGGGGGGGGGGGDFE